MSALAPIALGVAVVGLLAALMILSLCRAAADTRDVRPDCGEYDE